MIEEILEPLEPLVLVKQIGEHKWKYAEELLNNNPNLDEIVVQSSELWDHILYRNNEKQLIRLTIDKKNDKKNFVVHN
jgi:hypothetical protein